MNDASRYLAAIEHKDRETMTTLMFNAVVEPGQEGPGGIGEHITFPDGSRITKYFTKDKEGKRLIYLTED